jgi:DtxR family transcriptional regulator, manganese transport regulator
MSKVAKKKIAKVSNKKKLVKKVVVAKSTGSKPSEDVANLQSRATAFKAIRKNHSLEAAQDYTELVADLIDVRGEARICHIARYLGVSHVTALRTIRRLTEEGFLETSPHKPVTLTAKGKKVARESKDRHDALVKFFVKLGVPRKVAEIDVEGIEHHVSDETLKVVRKHAK